MKKSLQVSFLLIASSLVLSTPGFSADAQVAGLTGDSTAAVKHLADRYADASKGYRDAADRADNQGLKALLNKKADERAAYRSDLLAKAGLDPKATDGSMEGGAHRAWLNAKAVVTGENDLAIVQTVRAGEEEAVKSFSDLIGQPLPADVRDTVQDQYENVLESYKWAGDEIIKRSDDNYDADADLNDAKNDMGDKTDDAKDEWNKKKNETERKLD